jgi:hypothetical protein
MDIDFRLRRVGYVTSRYPQLQGLRLVPLAVVFLLSACWRAGLLRLPGDHTHYGPEVWFSSGVVIAVMLSYLARAWYARHVGAIGQRYVQNAAIPIVATCALIGAASAVQLAFAWHVSLPIAAVAMVLFVIGVRHYGYRGHYVLAAALLALLSVLPLTRAPANLLAAAFDATIGVTLLIAAVGDHVLLMTTLRGGREVLA